MLKFNCFALSYSHIIRSQTQLESPGVFALMLDDKLVVRASNFGSYNVTNCEGHARATLPPSAHPSVTQSPTSSPPVTTHPPTASLTVVNQSPAPSPTAVTHTPTPSPTTVTHTPTPSPSAVTHPPTASSRTVTQPPTPSPSKKCEDGSDRLRIEVTLGEQPCDSYWDLRDQRSDKTIVDVRYDVKVKDQTIVTQVCKPREDCYLFRLSTTDASALVFLNGNEIPKAIPPERDIKIGDSCC